MEVRETHKNEYTISTNKKKLDIDSIHKFLAKETDWASGIPINTLKISIENSLNFGLYYKNKQIGFARIISDYSTIAYLGDVYILKEHVFKMPLNIKIFIRNGLFHIQRP